MLKSVNVLSRYGFKQVSTANLLEVDDHPSYPSGLCGDQWVKECLRPQLDPGVPDEVAFLFERARGSMIYGQFFLPLASLATEEGFRVLEAGVRFRCKQLGMTNNKDEPDSIPDQPYAELVDTLHERRVIPKEDLDHWLSFVFLRNSFSHHKGTAIRRRHDAISQLSYIAELLNHLFKEEL
jgi:hypothetical protein